MNKEKEVIKSIYDKYFLIIYDKIFEDIFDSVYSSEKKIRDVEEYKKFKEDKNFPKLYTSIKDILYDYIYESLKEDFNTFKKQLLVEDKDLNPGLYEKMEKLLKTNIEGMIKKVEKKKNLRNEKINDNKKKKRENEVTQDKNNKNNQEDENNINNNQNKKNNQNDVNNNNDNKDNKNKDDNMNYNNNNNKDKENENIIPNEKIENEKEKIIKESYDSLGIDIGSLNTVYSIFGKKEGKFQSNVLLSDNTNRIIPSQICYSDTHRLYGDNASTLMTNFFSTSYSNLSRLLNFNINVNIYKEEYKNYTYYGRFQKSEKFKCYNKEEVSSSIIIADFLSLINEFYFEKKKKDENINYDFCTLSVPDYYTIFQKKELKLICESIGMKNINIINESTAITMYYGYTLYKNLFLQETNEVDPNIVKHVIFIDSGYSKTSFIYSTFSYSNFKVLLVKSYYNLGGRDIDEKLFDYCKQNFKKNQTMSKNDSDSFMNIKNKVSLLQAIDKARKALTESNDTTIFVDSFFDDEELNNPIDRQQYEEIIKTFIINFSNNLKKFKNKIKEINNNKLPDNLSVEMSGELMKTPILQKKIEDIFKFQISNTILIDECISVGCALFGYYIYDKLPINNFEKIYCYNYYNILIDDIQGNNNNISFKNSGMDNGESFIYEKKINDFKERNTIDFIFKYKDDDVNKICESKELYHFKINLSQLKNNNNNWEQYENIIFDIKFNYSDEVIFKIYLSNNNEKIECNIDNCIKIDESNIFSQENINKKKEIIKEAVNKHKKFDEKFLHFSEKKNKLLRKINFLKENKNDQELIDFEMEIKKLDSMDIKKKIEKIKEIEEKFKTYEKNDEKTFILLKDWKC